MDQKHAMLYPPIESNVGTMERDQRMSASAAIGLPTEAPPSYDVAMSSDAGAAGGWKPSAPQAKTNSYYQSYAHHNEPSMPVIVEQPAPLPYIPAQQQQPPQQQLQSPEPPATALPSKLGPNPCAVRCPACGACKTTRMCYTPNSRTHLCALLLCLVGWCCCACFVPYCMNSCRTGNHYCSKCNTFLGTYNPREVK